MCDPRSWNLQGQRLFFTFCFFLPVCRLSSSWHQRAARYTDPNPCRRPPCTREVWAPTAVPRTACRPIVMASPATPTPSWAPQRPATTWTLLVTGSPRRSVQTTSSCLCERSSVLHPSSPATPPPLLLHSLHRSKHRNCIWLEIIIQKQHVQQNNRQGGLLCSPSKALDLF